MYYILPVEMLFPGPIHGWFSSLKDLYYFYPYFSQSLKHISYIILFFLSFNLNVYFYFLFSAIFYYSIYKLIKKNE